MKAARFVSGPTLCLLVGICLLTQFGSRSPAADWNVAVIDQLLAGVAPGQRTVQVGDMEILVTNLRAWRNQLVGGPQPSSSFNSTAPLWTGGNVYYAFSNNVSAAKQKAFLDGAGEWAMFANLHLIARTTQANFVTIYENPAISGGQSAVGMIGGEQFLQIGPTSWNRPTICHEFGHTLGLIHEHQRSDRDPYVVVLTNNIIPGSEPNFTKLTSSQNIGPYDFYSIMHYGSNSLSLNPATLNTLLPQPAYAGFLPVFGRSDPVLSALDRAGMATNYGTGPALSSVVTNTLDSGPGSLRAALYYAFDHPGTTITFNIPVTDPGFSNSVFNILPTDALPGLMNATVLDATTEPTNSNPNGPEIFLNGALAGPLGVYPNGLRFRGTNCSARGFIVGGFPENGVLFDGAATVSNTLAGCFVGVTPAGTAPLTNRLSPVTISGGATANTVGGTTAAARNIISGSAFQGVFIRDAGTRENVIIGNFIGLNATGTAALSNRWAGVEIFGGAQSNRIGGFTAGERNVISGNGGQGVAFSGAGTRGNDVAGNFVGLNPAGTAALPNGGTGVEAFSGAAANQIGGATAGAGNVISGNTFHGIVLSGAGVNDHFIAGNFIGVNAAGTAALPNGGVGVGIWSGAQSNRIGGVGAGNVISGNANQGVVVANSGTRGNVVSGNYIGVNATGTAALGNAWAGVNLFGGPDSNLIGGTAPGAGNLISGNGGQGVLLQDAGTRNNLVQGNLIGLNVAGTAALPNAWSGVEFYNGPAANVIGGVGAARNFISGNGNYGVSLNNGSAANVVQGNTIGLNVANSAAVPNSYAGVALFAGAVSNQIGGVSFGAANLISGNTFDGVQMFDAATSNNTVRGNSMVSNSGAGLVLFSSANRSAAAPALTSAVLGTNTVVRGTLTSLASTTFQIDFYANPAPAAGAEGMTYLGARSVTTSAGGTVTFTNGLNALVPAGRVITATATDPAGNTSGFSGGVVVTTTSTPNDGIPDAWRAAMFGGSGPTTNSINCASCDPDGDGLDNWAEFLSGTNPTNSASLLELTALNPIGSGNVVSLPSVSGIIYRIESRDDIATSPWSLFLDQLVGTGSPVIITDTNAVVLPKRFYRAGVLW